MHRSVDFVRAHPFGCAVVALISINLIPATYAFRPWRVWQSWQLLGEWLRWAGLIVAISCALVGTMWLLVRWIELVDRWALIVHKQHQLMELELMRTSRAPSTTAGRLQFEALLTPEPPKPPVREMTRTRVGRASTPINSAPSNSVAVKTTETLSTPGVSLRKASDDHSNATHPVSLHKRGNAATQRPLPSVGVPDGSGIAAPPPISFQVDVSADLKTAMSAVNAVEEVFARHDITSALTPPPLQPVLIPASLVTTWRKLSTRTSLAPTHLPAASIPGGERT